MNCKLLHHVDRIGRLPVTLSIHLTNACNFRCKHCIYFTHSRTDAYNPNDALDTELAARIIEAFHESGGRGIQFSGGEPTLHEGFVGITWICERLGLDWAVTTNGSMCHRIIGSPTWVRVSLDAGTEDVWSNLHCTDVKLADVLDGIRDMVRRLPDTTIGGSMVVSKYNYTSITPFVWLCKDLGLSYARITYALMEDGADHFTDIDSRIRSSIANVTPKANSDNFKVKFQSDRLNLMRPHKRTFDTCHYAMSSSVVGADGYLYPCCELSYIKARRIRDMANDMSFGARVEVGGCPSCDMDQKNRDIMEIVRARDSCIHRNFL